MGQGKTKFMEDSDENEGVVNQGEGKIYTHPTVNADLVIMKRETQKYSEDTKKRRKWRRTQGYSLPLGFETSSYGEPGRIKNSFRGSRTGHFKDADWIDAAVQISQDDAVLVSYKKDPGVSDTSIPSLSLITFREKDGSAHKCDERLNLKVDPSFDIRQTYGKPYKDVISINDNHYKLRPTTLPFCEEKNKTIVKCMYSHNRPDNTNTVDTRNEKYSEVGPLVDISAIGQAKDNERGTNDVNVSDFTSIVRIGQTTDDSSFSNDTHNENSKIDWESNKTTSSISTIELSSKSVSPSVVVVPTEKKKEIDRPTPSLENYQPPSDSHSPPKLNSSEFLLTPQPHEHQEEHMPKSNRNICVSNPDIKVEDGGGDPFIKNNCINEFETRNGNKKHNKNAKPHNFSTPTINDVGEPSMNRHESPTNTHSTDYLIAPKSLKRDTDNKSSVEITASSIVNSICIDHNLEKRQDTDGIDSKTTIIRHCENGPTIEVQTKFGDSNSLAQEFLKSYEERMNGSKEDIANLKWSLVGNKTSHNDNENRITNIGNRKHRVMLKKTDDNGRKQLHNRDSDSHVENKNDLTRNPNMGQNVQEKIVLFNAKASVPAITAGTKVSLENQHEQYLHPYNTSPEESSRTTAKHAGQCQEAAVKKSIDKKPLPTKITQIPDPGSAPRIFRFQNVNEIKIATNAPEIDQCESLVDSKKCLSALNMWNNTIQSDLPLVENIRCKHLTEYQNGNETCMSTTPIHPIIQPSLPTESGNTDNTSNLPAQNLSANSHNNELNHRLKHLLDESAILIDVDDVCTSQFEGHRNSFHHARIAIVDSTISGECEPDLSFMPRIEEKEEEFLESTVDDDSDKESCSSLHGGLVETHSCNYLTDDKLLAEEKIVGFQNFELETAGDFQAISTIEQSVTNHTFIANRNVSEESNNHNSSLNCHRSQQNITDQVQIENNILIKNMKSRNENAGTEKIKQKSVTIISLPDSIKSPLVLQLQTSELDNIPSKNSTGRGNTIQPVLDSIEKDVLQEGPTTSEIPTAIDTHNFITEKGIVEKCGKDHNFLVLQTLDGTLKDDNINDIYDDRHGTPVDDSDEETADILDIGRHLDSKNPITDQNCDGETSNNKQTVNTHTIVSVINNDGNEKDHSVGIIYDNNDTHKSTRRSESTTSDVDTDSDNVAASPTRERKWTTSTDTSFIMSNQTRPAPVGCSSDDLQSNSSSSNSCAGDGVRNNLADAGCYDSLEDLSLPSKERINQVRNHDLVSTNLSNHNNNQRPKRSLPLIPVDFSRQQQKAFEILANNYTLRYPPSDYLTENIEHSQLGTTILNSYPNRHVEGRCDDQESFVSVEDNQHQLQKAMFDKRTLSDQRTIARQDEMNQNDFVSISWNQRKRQLPRIPEIEKQSNSIEFSNYHNCIENIVDIEAEEILRYNKEKRAEPAQDTNVVRLNQPTSEDGKNNKKSNDNPVSACEESSLTSGTGTGIEMCHVTATNSGDDSGCASMELSNFTSSKCVKDSKTISHFLWFGIDTSESDKQPGERNNVKIKTRVRRTKSAPKQIKNEFPTRSRRQALQHHKPTRFILQRSCSKSSPVNGTKVKKLTESTENRTAIMSTNKIEQQTHLRSDIKDPLFPRGSCVDANKSKHLRSIVPSTSKPDSISSRLVIGETVRVLQNSTYSL